MVSAPEGGAAGFLIEMMGALDGMAWWADRASIAMRLLDQAEALIPAARSILRTPQANWWPDDLNRRAQVALGPVDRAPDLAALVDEQWAGMSRLVRGLPQVLTTSTTCGPLLPAVRLCAAEAVDRWPDPVGIWAVSVDPAARIAEIHSLADWVDLCRRFPRVVPTPIEFRSWGVTSARSLVPDWRSLVGEFDAVHVSVAGYLTALGVVADVGDEQCVIEGVDSEVTVWFRNVLTVTELVSTQDHGCLVA